MSKMMILGVKGESGLWLIDFDAGSVTAMDGKREDYITTNDGVGASHDQLGSVDLAVTFEPKEGAFSGHYYKTPSVDLAVAFEQQEGAFSGHVYKTPSVDLAVAFEAKEDAFSGHLYKSPAAGR